MTICLETLPVLNNMSAPPKSAVKYSGLASLGADGTAPDRYAAGQLYGTPVRFSLPPGLDDPAPEALLRHLGIPAGADPAGELAALVERRAAELPLPDGCAVIPPRPAHPAPWPDTLSALAILAKCSNTLWLRGKHPAFGAALARRAATLLVPPAFTHRLPETRP